MAAVIERDDGRFLLVEEHTADGLRLNNPAGHLEQGESPLEAVVREVLEETAHPFEPEALLGIYFSRFQRPASGEDVTYLRIAYRGRVGAPIAGRALDAAIVRLHWLTPAEIRARAAEHRSPLLQRCIDDHRAGLRLPLTAVQTDPTLYRPEQKRGPKTV